MNSKYVMLMRKPNR